MRDRPAALAVIRALTEKHPDDAALALRGLRTLGVRLERETAINVVNVPPTTPATGDTAGA